MAWEDFFTGMFQGSNVWVNALFWILYFVGIIGLLLSIVWFASRWPYLVLIRARRGMGTMTYIDWGRVAKDRKNGAETLNLLKRRKILPKPEGRYIAPKRGLFKRFMIEYFEDDAGEYQPIELAVNSPPVLMVNPQGQKMWHIMATQLAHDRWQYKQGFFQQYGAIVLNISLIFMTFIIMLYLVQQIADVAQSMGGVASSLQQVAGVLAGSIK